MYPLFYRSQRFFFLLVLSMCIGVQAQDIIEKKNGQQIRGRVISLDKKTLIYKPYDDPEFISYTIDKKELKKITYENGKVMEFGLEMPKNYIAFSMGGCGPLGELRSKSEEKAKYSAGYLKGGIFARFDAGIYLRKNFGIAIQIGGMNFRIDKDAVLHDLVNEDNAENPPVEIHYFDSKDSSKESKIANFNAMNIGLLYTKPIGTKHNIDFRIMSGILNMRTHSLLEVKTFYPEDPDKITHVYREYKVPTRMLLSLGVAYRYSITERWALRANLDWYSAVLKRSYSIKSQGAGALLFTDGTNTNLLRFRALNIGLGIVYQINRKNS